MTDLLNATDQVLVTLDVVNTSEETEESIAASKHFLDGVAEMVDAWEQTKLESPDDFLNNWEHFISHVKESLKDAGIR